MATRRRATALFVVLLSLGSELLLSGDAVPQGYHTRHTRAHKCKTCPSDCSDKLAGAQVHVVYAQQVQPSAEAAQQYATVVASQPAEAAQQYATAAASQPSYPPHPTQASYVTPTSAPSQPQAQYSAASAQAYQYPVQQPYGQSPARTYQQAYQPASQYIPQPNPHYNFPYNGLAGNYLPDPYDYPGYDCAGSPCRCGRSLGADDDDVDDYPVYSKYNRRSLDETNEKYKEVPARPLPFADESTPPADFYRNYKPYERDYERFDDGSEERASRRGPGRERDRLFVVYRADEFDDKPSDSELESVIRQAMDVARQQKTQENFARNGRRSQPYRYRYEHEKLQRRAEPAVVDFKPLKSGEPETQRFNLSPGPLMSAGESYVAEEGDDALNPGMDQSKWTVVPSLSDLQLSADQMHVGEEIEAAVSVVPELPKMAVTGDEKLKKVEEVERKNEKMTELIKDMPTPSTAVETTSRGEKPAENVMSIAPTTNVSVQ